MSHNIFGVLHSRQVTSINVLSAQIKHILQNGDLSTLSVMES